MRWFAKLCGWCEDLFGSTLKPTDVFTPGGVPSITYVSRAQFELEEKVRKAVDRGNSFIVLSGPTKCGKSVLYRKALGSKRHITVHGGQVETADQFWESVAARLNLPSSYGRSRKSTNSARASSRTSFGVPGFFNQAVTAEGGASYEAGETENFNSVAVIDALDALAKRRITLIVEDFHFLEQKVQRSILRALKSAVFEGLKVVLLAVPQHAFDPSDVESEVEGRVHHVKINRWSNDDLAQICVKGFDALGIYIPANVIDRICEDGFGNPLLVQEICLEVCDSMPQNTPLDGAFLSKVYERIISQKGLERYDRVGNSRTVAGYPPVVELRDGGEEVTAAVLLASVARLGPLPVTSYQDIQGSFSSLSRANPPTPEMTSMIFDGIADTVSMGGAPPLEWLHARQELALNDPFMMFYMRWVLRDKRSMQLRPSAMEAGLRVQPTRAEDTASSE